MKRIATLIFIAAFTLLAALPVQAATKLYTTVDANLRKGPGLEYRKVTAVKAGTALTYRKRYKIDERGVKWYKVNYKKKKNVWISSKCVSFKKPGKTRVIAKADANLRWGPGLDYGIYTSVEKGTSMAYQKKYAYDYRGVKWYKVYYKGYYAWISSSISKLK